MNEYTSLSKLRTFLSLGSADTGDDTHLQTFIKNASRAIDRFTRRTFYPSKIQLEFDLPDSATVLRFGRDDILEAKGLSDVNGASEIDSSVYFLKCGDTHNLSPYDRLEILTDSGSTFNYSGTPQKAIRFDAIVGYHGRYNNAWIDSGASLTDALAASITLASVSGSAGEDVRGFSPRFSVGQIWRLSGGTDSEEYVWVMDTAPEEGTNGSVVRLLRGINGTTQASHAASTTVEVFETEPDIEFATRQLAAWVYHQSLNPFSRSLVIPQMGVVEMQGNWPPDLKMALKYYQKRKLYSSRF